MVNISIIIPIYNMEQFLARCLDSIVAQGVSPHEVIMVNDGSTDGSREIALRYVAEYPYMRYIEQPNGGVSVARNTGMKEATGEYICFCDPDDYYMLYFLSKITSVVEEHIADLYRFGYIYLSENSKISQNEVWRTYAEDNELSGTVKLYSREELLEGNDLHKGGMLSCRFLFRRDLVVLHGLSFPPGIVVQEDEIFLFRYLKYAKSMADIDSRWYVYERGENSITASVFSSFNAKAASSFKANSLILLKEWGKDAPLAVRERIEGNLFSFTMSYILLPHLSDERLAELRKGIKEVRSETKQHGIKLQMEWRYEIMYRAFRSYRWLFRTKKKCERWVLSKK